MTDSGLLASTDSGQPPMQAWKRLLSKKWLSRRTGGERFNSDSREDEDEDNMPNYCKLTNNSQERDSPPNRRNSGGMQFQVKKVWNQYMGTNKLRLVVGSWNVGGISPPQDVNLEDWLGTKEPADIYVLGYQEVVPLNAANVFCTEDITPAKKWDAHIRKALNDNNKSMPRCPISMDRYNCNDNNYSGRSSSSSSNNSNSSSFSDISRRNSTIDSIAEDTNDDVFSLQVSQSFSSPSSPTHQTITTIAPTRNIPSISMIRSRNTLNLEPPISSSANIAISKPPGFPNQLKFKPGRASVDLHRPSHIMDSDNISHKGRRKKKGAYVQIVSKQMVGIFISIWIRKEFCCHIHALQVSTVGCGLMGYLGNKGSISVSMSLFQTNLCFICTHLASGEKDGDGIRRNMHVAEILKRTQFRRSSKLAFMALPESILAHDRIVWFGDLNYRLSLPLNQIKCSVINEDWEILLQVDQLRAERESGGCFEGWQEGAINFAPTYKYMANSDNYSGMHMLRNNESGHQKRTGRAPAWCDRILWYGKGLEQIEYVRSESRLSDHRPVRALFIVQVEDMWYRYMKHNHSIPITPF